MGLGSLFSSKSSSSSSTKNETTNTSGTIGDLSTGNIQATGGVTLNGIAGDDLGAFLNIIKDATASNSSIAGNAIQTVASGYQSAYSETTGIIQQLKPVLMVAAAVFAFSAIPKFLKEFK